MRWVLPHIGLLLLASGGGAPEFARYPAGPVFRGRLLMPKIVGPEERRFRTVLRQGVGKGYRVVDGGTEHERRGVNFAGRYVLVQWGCGSNCMQAAVIDGRDGTVLHLPQVPGEPTSQFEVPTGSVDLRTLEFRTRSRLLGIPCVGDGMTYYYVLEGHRWRFVRKTKTPEGHD